MDGAEADPSSGEEDAASRLTEDLILEILSRLPAKSLHRFKCVSRQWLRLISHPDHQSKMAQTLTGYLYIGYTTVKSLYFTSALDGPPPLVDPSALSAAPSCFEDIHRVDCSNGLVLLHYWMPEPDNEVHCYTVCNPATDEWAAVPVSPIRGVSSLVRLAVDPSDSASPLHFRIFEFRTGGARGSIVSAEIYSSESGAWTHRECEWDVGGAGITVRDQTSGAVLDGMFHMAPIEPVLVSVGCDGNTWKTCPKPSSPGDDGFLGGPAPGFLSLSQGRLQFLNTLEYDYMTLCNWELDDGGVWVMKHSINLAKLFAGRMVPGIQVRFSVIGMHPDCNIVYFLQGKNNTLISCAMDRDEKSHRVIRDLGYNNFVPYVPYVPRYKVPLAIRALED